MALIDMLLEYRNTRGINRLVVMTRLRAYIKNTARLEVLEEIQAIYDEEFLNVLIGVGMPGILYYALISQKAKMSGIT